MKTVVVVLADAAPGEAGGLMRAALRIAAEAKRSGSDVSARAEETAADQAEGLVIGASESEGTCGGAVVQELAAAGASCIICATHAGLARPLQSEQVLDALMQALTATGHDVDGDAPTLFVLPATPMGDEIAARAAMRCGATALGRCNTVSIAHGRLTGHRAAFGGRAQVQLQAVTQRAFVSVRPERAASASANKGSSEAPNAPSNNASIAAASGWAAGQPAFHHATQACAPTATRLVLDGPLPPAASIHYLELAGQKQGLQTARLVVSGGRGMGGPEGFVQLGELAEALGGALGGSLPAVDAGWVPVAAQVGQSGTYVTPLVYVAVGISGTLQHLAGIGPDVRIVAINNDPDAPIFTEAQVGVVADWRAILPRVVEHAGKPG